MNEKAVLLSIQPKWCGLIASGKKTIEVRKTRPKIETPFKCYIYQSKSKDTLIYVMKDGDEDYGVIYHGKPVFIKTYSKYSNPYEQKVIGEFVCDAIISHCEMANADIAEQQGCIRREQLFEYANGAELYGWHISELKIYNKPKALSEFGTLCDEDCPNCEFWKRDMVNQYERDMDCTNSSYPLRPLKRPPQSWCYVEVEK